jgi:hypothetical protein
MFGFNISDVDDSIYYPFEETTAPVSRHVHFGAAERKRRAFRTITTDEATALINYYFAALMV